MDTLTHSLVGVTLANAGLKERYGRGTTLALLLASNVPDLDVFGGLFNPEPSFLYRRMFTHSLLALPILSAGFAALFWLFHRTKRFLPVWYLWALGMSLHIAFDLINSYGVVLFYPLSRHRFELAGVYIVDLALWILMLAPLIVYAIRPAGTNLAKLSRFSACAVVLYLGMCFGLRWRSIGALENYEANLGTSPAYSYVFPEPLGPQRFRGVVREKDTYEVVQINSLTEDVTPFAQVQTEDGLRGAHLIAESGLGSRFLWFAKAPVFRRISRDPDGAEEWTLSDLRFSSTVIARGKNFFRYGFSVNNDKVRFHGRIPGDVQE